MDECESPSHSNWECEYHAIFTRKSRRKTLHGSHRSHLGVVFQWFAEQEQNRIEDRQLMPDHVRMMTPPEYAIAEVVGYIKGESASPCPRVWRAQADFVGQHVWARGYIVSTAG